MINNTKEKITININVNSLLDALEMTAPATTILCVQMFIFYLTKLPKIPFFNISVIKKYTDLSKYMFVQYSYDFSLVYLQY